VGYSTGDGLLAAGYLASQLAQIHSTCAATKQDDNTVSRHPVRRLTMRDEKTLEATYVRLQDLHRYLHVLRRCRELLPQSSVNSVLQTTKRRMCSAIALLSVEVTRLRDHGVCH
jgi:hypothetical protein